ncbi:MAG: DNA polymerase III subunit chi [Hydrogenophaga sp.]
MRFAKVVEVVTEDETDRLAARDRWRMYRQNGVEPVHHDLRSRTG